MSGKLKLVGVVLTSVALIAAVVTFAVRSSHEARSSDGDHGTAAIANAPPIPTWLATGDPTVLAEYRWAAAHHDELQYVPCYCGCTATGHTSNATCYFRWDKDGNIQGYDNHAFT